MNVINYLIKEYKFFRKIKKIKKSLLKTSDINSIYHLDFIGKTEERKFKKYDAYYFNIIDPKHKRYRSTILYIDHLKG